MNILISNDDGYLAPGIQELARRIRRFGNVTVGCYPNKTTAGPVTP